MLKNQKNELKIVNYNGEYKDLVLFAPNRFQPVHRWFPMVEGFSSELVRRIIGEQDIQPQLCVDPFGGVGTTALTCQDIGIQCVAFENNPFFFEIARTKLRTDYYPEEFKKLIQRFDRSLKRMKKQHKLPKLETQTLFETEGLDKWVFSKPVTNGILDVLSIIRRIEMETSKYTGLFKAALASILISVSNVFRNGKCLSYKKGWKDLKIAREEVHHRFLDVCNNILLIDIRTKHITKPLVYNYVNCIFGDARTLVADLYDESIDLVITSPPYLNSRDYTDSYRTELWLLGYISTFEEERKVRKAAIRSHVQVTLEKSNYPKVPILEEFIRHIENMDGNLWNRNIPNMIKGYFDDMEGIFRSLKAKLKPKGKVYINIANSAYGGEVCQVDVILTEIAKGLGFKPLEIRFVRHIKPSRQQKEIEKLRESIIVLENG